MKQFVPTFRGQDWESGAGALHLYVRPEEADTEFRDLVAAVGSHFACPFLIYGGLCPA